jgi:hypothetical protein
MIQEYCGYNLGLYSLLAEKAGEAAGLGITIPGAERLGAAAAFYRRWKEEVPGLLELADGRTREEFLRRLEKVFEGREPDWTVFTPDR